MKKKYYWPVGIIAILIIILLIAGFLGFGLSLGNFMEFNCQKYQDKQCHCLGLIYDSGKDCYGLMFSCGWAADACYGPTQVLPDIQEKRASCQNSNGTFKLQSCCNSTEDYPDTCLIGACGCSPANSYQVEVCDCGEGRCWNSTESKCVTK